MPHSPRGAGGHTRGDRRAGSSDDSKSSFYFLYTKSFLSTGVIYRKLEFSRILLLLRLRLTLHGTFELLPEVHAVFRFPRFPQCPFSVPGSYMTWR